ncbi:MAG: anaerobic ribonucleoside-triphosphate reductase activating protein [Clostridia bacterium]|nr:anaerobic ribonucleoside-triphosphate reductase activating protein [Clostridia bacterium]
MKISGFQKMTVLDFPGKVACTVFTGGCNMRCPFCHNADLALNKGKDSFTEEEILEYLGKRQGLLDGVCITGGEPLLHSDIGEFIRKIKALGYMVKLDTNGTFPERLKDLVNDGLLDYVAMDIKNSKEKYAQTAGANIDISKIEESVAFLMEGKVDYEFRTTVVSEFHEKEDILKISEWIKGAKRYFLQNFVDSGNLIEKNILHAVTPETLESMRVLASSNVAEVVCRGI